jgi:hypothetical protein
VFVFDTTAYLNGWRDHYPPTTFPGVWNLLEEQAAADIVITVREVYREIIKQDDDVSAWAKATLRALVVEPSPEVQRDAGVIAQMFPKPGVRNGADPFILAEARARGFCVVTYEGRSYSGAPHKKWWRTMPSVCQKLDIPCCTLPEALRRLDAMF